MKALLVLTIALSCVGCAINRDGAAAIATREVARRKLPLPKNHTVAVIEGKWFQEFERTQAIWVVILGVPDSKHPRYTVHILQRAGAVVSFTDSRTLRPLRP